MDEMAMEADGKNQQPGQVLLLEAGYILDREQNFTAQAIQLLDETVRNLARPPESLEKIHILVSDTTQDDDSDRCAWGYIRLHISVTESHMHRPFHNLGIGTSMKDAHQTWGMFLVQHSETDAAGKTCKQIELRLYREIG